MFCGGGHLAFSYGKNVSKRFFSETTWKIEPKLSRNDHWKVLYKSSSFRANPLIDMAATANTCF
jgi:hypothetical protein